MRSTRNAMRSEKNAKAAATEGDKILESVKQKAKIANKINQNAVAYVKGTEDFTNLNDCDIDNDNALYFNGKLNNSNNITKREFMNYLTGENNTKNNTKKMERIKNKNDDNDDNNDDDNDDDNDIDENYDLYSNVNKVGAILFFALCIILILKHKKYFK